MTEVELAVVTILTCSVGGALGAKNAKAEAWKGFVIIAVSMIVTMVIFTLLNIDNDVVVSLASIVIAGVVGAILKMSPRQTSLVIIGGLLFAVVAAVLISLIS
ncbi:MULTISPECIES: hypothetical protein [Rhizobium]|uniref:NADH:ubiquinone oxidoreductase subunit B-like Fe-S oxidoreductase n=1 Tax=Rhizobium esperanzae TaxID=1967781 RepID=A0A7W6UMY6_9HYPH|nr:MULTISPECIES: hypothetical protein [Rhizobium]MBB4441178.1 NADH:ubiquinone oxidoreductase subunit B-like Fe-S oxidoreductase [Rhizobium esperanzae]MDH6204099.1 NADH:ubiquinone oxidoreductase subunit B-like Fe-S oxidoreductase [Rhizobium leguminosarum]OAV52359.1 hypothetical protein A6U98_26510 [Rhizobium sp. WYCCWR10014]